MPEVAPGRASVDEALARAMAEAADVRDIDLVTFDFWDTLVLRTESPESVRVRTCAEVVQQLDLTATAEQLHRLVVDAAGALRSAASQLGLDDEYRSRSAWAGVLRELLPIGEDIEGKVAIVEGLEVAAHSKATRVSPAVLAGVARLQGRRWCVVSDNEMSAKQLKAIAAAHGLDVPVVHVSSDSGLCKRSGRLFGHVFASEGSTPTRTFHVGDDAWGDRAVPRRLGVRIPSEPLPESHWGDSSKPQNRAKSVSRSHASGPESLGPSVAHFIHLTHTEVRRFRADRVLFMGSEGAFFSSFFDTASTATDAPAQCVNLGRRHLLGAALAADPAWVVHRCLVSGIPVASVGAVAADPFGTTSAPDAHAIGERLVRTYWQQGRVDASDLPLPPEEYIRCRDMRFRELGLAKTDGVAVVDVGYRATTAMAIARAFGTRVLSIAMFGEPAYLSAAAAEHRWWLEVEGRQWRAAEPYGQGALPKDTPPLEILLAAGPRAPQGDHRLHRARSLLLRGIRVALRDGGRTGSPAEDASEWRRFLESPSVEIARAILDAAHEDDLHQAGGGEGSWRPRYLKDAELWPAGARVAHPVLGSRVGSGLLKLARRRRQLWRRARVRGVRR